MDPASGKLAAMNLLDVRIGHIIKLERQKKRLTLDQLGNLVGCDHSTLCGYEAGRRRLPAARVDALATVFGIPPKIIDPEAYQG
ncbi:helix-turn-helix transcriptional regulator [Paenarthrobacter sp. Y-19]|uniref:helix-turn-helix domain-containing protein n=1 Tax=Paenarthrobacter sp. Y-19 TaxID=3031125 RepID=UPI0023DAAFCB|nr:helix-turn-helix transcriptional regulator [Paenarthrobacter sp. Y-19]